MNWFVGIRMPFERLQAFGNASGIVGIEAGLADGLAHALHNDARYMVGIVAKDSLAVDASTPNKSVCHHAPAPLMCLNSWASFMPSALAKLGHTLRAGLV